MLEIAGVQVDEAKQRERESTPRAVRHRIRLLLHEFDLPEGETLVGRGASCGLTIFDPLLSREHVAIWVDGPRATLRDVGSVNGTRLNGAPLAGVVALQNGDRIGLGHQELVFLRVTEERRRRVSEHAERTSIPTPFAAVDRQSWWIDLQLDLLDRALADARADDADGIFRFVADTLVKRGEREPFDRTRIDALLARAVRFALLASDAGWIGWALSLMRATDAPPSARALIELQLVPPAILVEASAELDQLLERFRARGRELDREQLRLVEGFRIVADRARG